MRRTRRVVALVLLAVSAWWLLVRRRSAADTWTELPSELPDEPGPPGELPADVLATDAGLTEVPSVFAPSGPPAPADTLATDAGITPVPAAGRTATGPEETPAATGTPAALPESAGDEAAAADAADPDLPDVVEPAVETVVLEEAVVEADADGGGPIVVEDAVVQVDLTPAFGDLPVPEPVGIDEPTAVIPIPPAAPPRVTSPAFSEAPTMEIPAVTDDLRAVRGIGPSMERMLHSLGIVSFRQLALLDGSELERVRDELHEFRTRIEREDWIGQARALHKDKYGAEPA